MSQSDLDQLIAAERDEPPVPTSDGAAANWRRINRSVAAGAVAPFDLPPASVAPTTGFAAATSTPLKLLLVSVLGAGATVATVATVTTTPATSETPPATVAERSAPTEPAAPAPAPAEVATPPAPPEPPPPAAASAPPVPPPASTAPVPTPPPATTPAPRSRAPKSRRAAAPTGIGRELDLIKRATQAANDGRHKSALALLRTHKSEFAAGALAQDREALRVAVLCASGRTRAGRAAVKRFNERFPQSVHTKRVNEACADGSEVEG